MKQHYKRITIFILLIISFQFSIFTINKTKNKNLLRKISVNFKNILFEEVLQILEKKSNIKFNYNRNRIPINQKITLKLSETPIIDILNHILNKTKTDLKITKSYQYMIIPLKGKKKIPKGTLQGKILFKETDAPLQNIEITILENGYKSFSNNRGEYNFSELDIGNYTVEFNHDSFKTKLITDVLIKPKRITFLNTKLVLAPIHENIIVRSHFFSSPEDQELSQTSFSNEEIKRNTEYAGDISRVLGKHLSINNFEDVNNNMNVRGGSNSENGYFVDNIEISNINHMAFAGDKGGYASLINIDLIEKINFYAGGFPTQYGDFVSSITSIKIREGNRIETDTQVDLNFSGIGIIYEGPIAKNNGSFLLSFRNSFNHLLFDIVNSDSPVPEYTDIFAKINIDLSNRHKLSILNLTGFDRMNISTEEAIYDSVKFIGNLNTFDNISGINWKYLWGVKGYTETTFSFRKSKQLWDFFLLTNGEKYRKKDADNNEFRIRSINHFFLNIKHQFDFGIEAEFIKNRYDDIYFEDYDLLGNKTPKFIINKLYTANQYGLFFNHRFKPIKRININYGFYLNYSSNNNIYISPRLFLSYSPNSISSIQFSYGLYYQNLPVFFLSFDKNHINMKAHHYILGINRLINNNTKVTLELYYKKYNDFPMDPKQPQLFIIDESVYRNYYYPHEKIVSAGTAFSYGFEFNIQKKFINNFYAYSGFTFFRARYKDLLDIWRDRIYDSKYKFILEIGYKPSPYWNILFKYSRMGGIPYSPYNIEESERLNSGVLYSDRVNSERLNYIDTVNFRIDKRFLFSNANLSVYFSIWNLFDKKDTIGYLWTEYGNFYNNHIRLGIMPIFGLEFEF